jgi:hypothetical protein
MVSKHVFSWISSELKNHSLVAVKAQAPAVVGVVVLHQH